VRADTVPDGRPLGHRRSPIPALGHRVRAGPRRSRPVQRRL